MARQARVAPRGLVYHVLNRAVARLPLFRKPADFEAFERVLQEAQTPQRTRILAWCLMRNHWHLVLWPRADGELTAFVRWLTHTHVTRWHVAPRDGGWRAPLPGTFQELSGAGGSTLADRVPVRGAKRLYGRGGGTSGGLAVWDLWVRQEGPEALQGLLAEWPLERPRNWVRAVNTPLRAKELERVHISVARGRPYWQPG